MKRRWSTLSSLALAGALALTSSPFGARVLAAGAGAGTIKHVLLISVDGLHASDLQNYVATHPDSTLASLSGMGVTYPNASTSRPSDSFPGLLSIVTGGSPKSTGVYYDASYDRTLYAPSDTSCITPGAEIVYDESIDYNPNATDGGRNATPDSIDRDKLPRTVDLGGNCIPLYPHDFLKVNTIFQVIKRAGLRTAWADKHPAYDIVNGPSSYYGVRGVDALYTPEINGVIPDPDNMNSTDIGTTNVTSTIRYDNLKVQAIVNETDGHESVTPTVNAGVPAIFGMNFQAVSVAQKAYTGGYAPDPRAIGGFTPTGDLVTALDYVDTSIGRMVHELGIRGLLTSTQVIVTAKHGQAPIDRSTLRRIGHQVGPVLGAAAAHVTDDDVALVWLNDQSKTGDAVNTLTANKSKIAVSDPSTQILSGSRLARQFGDPTDMTNMTSYPRTPDIIVTPDLGVIYTGDGPTKKISEHGGFSKDDTNVALLVSNPNLTAAGTTNTAAVSTTQIAPSILSVLGINPSALQAVQLEKTQTLPGLNYGGTAPTGNGTALAVTMVQTNELSPTVTDAPDAVGTVSVTADPAADQVCYAATVSGLTSRAIEFHIHHGAAGQNGPVVVPFVVPPMDPNGAATAPFGGVTRGCLPNVDAMHLGLVEDIAANPGNYYVNLHTTTHPMGEIRSQLALAQNTGGGAATPELGSGELVATALLPLAGVLLYRRQRRARRGVARQG